MPSELRHILFRPCEVAQAVKEYHRRMKTPLPPGTIVRCGAECEKLGGALRFRLVLAPDPIDASPLKPGEDGRQEVVVEGPALAAALILFCHDKRIPLPAASDKTLQRFGDQVGLIITINPRQDELPPVERLR